MSARKDKQSCEGLGQYHLELKRLAMIGLIPTVLEQLDELAAEFYLSRFKLVEQIAQRMISVGTP